MNDRQKGFLFTGILSIVIIFIFFGKIVLSPSDYFFSADGDGFKAYYGAMYHVEHDSTYMRMNGMNYPYGEMVFFTGCQPPVANFVKFVNHNIFNIEGSSNVVGVMNVLMIFSIMLAAIFLYLLFFELNINWIYASVVSVGICMLSPQLGRFGGHFSLSWLFWLPLMLWQVIRFDKSPNYIRAVGIGVITFLAAAMHMYFFAFYGFIIGFYFLAQFVNKNRKFGIFRGLTFFCIQYIFPFIFFQLILASYDFVTDRTAFPYGFFAYSGHPVGIFLPSGKPYGFVPKFVTVFNHISWESLAFIGVVALAGFLTGFYEFGKKVISWRNPLIVTDKFILNILFWSSFAALLFSFGLPFKLGILEGLIDKLGPLRQLRALARFSWLFYYTLNIVVFYNLYGASKKSSNKTTWKVISVLAFGFLLFDGFWNIKIDSKHIQNHKPLIADVKNVMSENEWVGKINPEDYQAIMPFPYFHVGSENIWIDSKFDTQEMIMMASLKTGLPTTGVQLSRTSIGQTYKNYALVTEPLEAFEIIGDFPSQKPFLLFHNRKYTPNRDEQRLISAGELLYQNEEIELRSLSVAKLAEIHNNYIEETKALIKDVVYPVHGDYLVNDSSLYFLHKSFDESPKDNTWQGKGALQYSEGKWFTLLNDTLEMPAGRKYKLSFWMKDYEKDAHLRAVLEFVQSDPNTNEVTNYFYSDAHRHIKGFQENWALIELNFETKADNEIIKLSIRNSILKNENLILDELLIREEGLNICYPASEIGFFNTRKLSTIQSLEQSQKTKL